MHAEVTEGKMKKYKNKNIPSLCAYVPLLLCA